MHAGLEEMRGPGMAQGVYGGPLMATAGREGGSEGRRHAMARHGCGGRRPPEPTTAWCGKAPDGRAGCVPGRAE
jgi:hypothetical protein